MISLYRVIFVVCRKLANIFATVDARLSPNFATKAQYTEFALCKLYQIWLT